MSYIDKNLIPGETILYRTKKHLIIFLVPVLWTIATLFCLVNSNPMANMLAIAPAFAALVTFGYYGLDYVTSEYALTNKRIMMREGFFFRHTNELRLITVSNITVNQSLIGQMLDYGSVIINPFGGQNDVFSLVAKAYEFQKQTQIELDKATSGMR